MAKSTTLELSEEELIELKTITRSSKAEKRMVDRAKIILAWHDGKSFVQTQQETGMSQMAISKWRDRFKANRIRGRARCSTKWQASNLYCNAKG